MHKLFLGLLALLVLDSASEVLAQREGRGLLGAIRTWRLTWRGRRAVLLVLLDRRRGTRRRRKKVTCKEKAPLHGGALN
jgi:hypothetical protein